MLASNWKYKINMASTELAVACTIPTKSWALKFQNLGRSKDLTVILKLLYLPLQTQAMLLQTVTLSQDSRRQWSWWQCSLAEVSHQTTGPCFRQCEDLSTHMQTWGPGPDSTVYKYIQWMTQTLHGSLWGGRRWRKVNEESAGTLKPNERNAACKFQIKLSAVPES